MLTKNITYTKKLQTLQREKNEKQNEINPLQETLQKMENRFIWKMLRKYDSFRSKL